jgi:hypothetical protein
MPLTIIRFLHGDSVDALRTILPDENILLSCSSTTEAVSRTCAAFCESGRFPSPISYKKIGILLGIDSKTALPQWKRFQLHGLWDAPTGRLSILTDGQLDQVIEFAVKQFYSMQPAASARLVRLIHSQSAIDVSPDTLRRALQRDQRSRTCPGIPMEAQRVHVTPQALMEYFPIQRNTIDGVPIPFIWNMDEIGHFEWADSHPETVYVPSDSTVGQVPIPVDRAGERITLGGVFVSMACS